MEFEMQHLDIIQSEGINHSKVTSQSLILNELQKETEELQNKLKLNNRRLLLFETENNKLIEEKNKLFFETQNTIEKIQLFSERNVELENQFVIVRNQNELLNEKNESYIKINQKLKMELKRFTKFHAKIQNVIKPYIEQLKASILQLKTDLSKSNDVSELSQTQIKKMTTQFDSERFFYNQKITAMELDKNQTIASYEEQIHSFSKEIIRLEQQKDDFSKEVARLKKAVEFKNYFENELIKFKRIHEEDQREVQVLKDKLSALEVRLMESDQTTCLQFEKLKYTENQLIDTSQMLEATRDQLAKNLDHSHVLNERLARLEKLNLNLSQQMHQMT